MTTETMILILYGMGCIGLWYATVRNVKECWPIRILVATILAPFWPALIVAFTVNFAHKDFRQ